MILCDHLIAADILDLPVETILTCHEKKILLTLHPRATRRLRNRQNSKSGE
jgi:hypothetical protein